MRFNLFLCQLCAGVALLKCVCVCVCFSLLRTASQTLRQSFTSSSSSSRPPCFPWAWLRFSSITAGSSARTDPLSVGGVLRTRMRASVCFEFWHSVCKASAGHQHCFLGICLLCLHSVIFALMMKDAVWLPPPPFSICHHSHQHTALMSLFGLLSDRGVSHYVCTVAHFVPVHGREWIIQRSMLQCNAKTQGWEQ